MGEVRLWRHLQMKGRNILSRLRQCLQITSSIMSVTPSFVLRLRVQRPGVMKYKGNCSHNFCSIASKVALAAYTPTNALPSLGPSGRFAHPCSGWPRSAKPSGQGPQGHRKGA